MSDRPDCRQTSDVALLVIAGVGRTNELSHLFGYAGISQLLLHQVEQRLRAIHTAIPPRPLQRVMCCSPRFDLLAIAGKHWRTVQ